MGLDTDIAKLIRDKWATKSVLTNAPLPKEPFVDIVDFPTEITNKMGPNLDYLMTGLEFYAWKMEPVRHLLMNTACIAYIFSMDDQPRVPKEKEAEQKNRMKEPKDKTKIVYPYSDDVKIGDKGVAYRTEEGELIIESLDMRRMAKTRGMRKKLCAYMVEKFKQNEVIPHGKYLILDYHGDGPHVLTSDARSVSTVIQESKWKHEYGEADLGVFFWAHIFYKYTRRMYTIDTDYIAISTAYVGSVDKKYTEKPIYWICPDRCTFKVQTMVRDTLDALDIPWQAFLLACILAGTDFAKKKLILNGINVLAVFKATIRSIASISAPDVGIDIEDPKTSFEVLIDLILRWAYDARFDFEASEIVGNREGIYRTDSHMLSPTGVKTSGKYKELVRTHSNPDGVSTNVKEENTEMTTNNKRKPDDRSETPIQQKKQKGDDGTVRKLFESDSDIESDRDGDIDMKQEVTSVSYVPCTADLFSDSEEEEDNPCRMKRSGSLLDIEVEEPLEDDWRSPFQKLDVLNGMVNLEINKQAKENIDTEWKWIHDTRVLNKALRQANPKVDVDALMHPACTYVPYTLRALHKRIEKKKLKMIHVPEAEQRKNAYKIIRFNFLYWANHWDKKHADVCL